MSARTGGAMPLPLVTQHLFGASLNCF
jgi:hypothetical protein